MSWGDRGTVVHTAAMTNAHFLARARSDCCLLRRMCVRCGGLCAACVCGLGLCTAPPAAALGPAAAPAHGFSSLHDACVLCVFPRTAMLDEVARRRKSALYSSRLRCIPMTRTSRAKEQEQSDRSRTQCGELIKYP